MASSIPPAGPPAKRLTRRHVATLRGTAQLAADATLGVTAVVEGMHARIASPPGLRGGDRTRGLTGFVYRSVRGVTRGVAGRLDLALGALERRLAEDHGAAGLPDPRVEAWRAALNGVVGDHLAATGNPLALPMRLRHAGRELPPDRDRLAAWLPGATGRVLLLVHGLCMNDLQWQRDGEGHGVALARAAGWTPIGLHYNTGLTIPRNGAALADAMEGLLAAWPVPVERVAILAHSMGGLVARSALHRATAAGRCWPARVSDLVCLGTPHAGAPLERGGHAVERLLASLPYAAPLAALGRLRSAGILDLRDGRVTDDGSPLPLPAGVRCHAVAGRLGRGSRWLGDGLVPVDSALGRSGEPARRLHFESERQAVFENTGHFALLDHPAITQLLIRWLA